MPKPIQITLPVMLNSAPEVETFLSAKERIEALGTKYSVPVEVGAFLPFMPGFARKPDAYEAQLANQAKYRLPIRLVETGIQRQNSLAYAEGVDPTYNPEVTSDLNDVVDQVARLRDLDPNPLENLVVAPHIGILAVNLDQGDYSIPGFLSVKDFADRREKLLVQATNRFGELRKRGESLGLDVCLENAYLASFQNSSYWQTQSRPTEESSFDIVYETLNDLPSLLQISQGNIVFDLAHLAAMQNIPAQFAENKDVMLHDDLFSTMNISSWEEYNIRVGHLDHYLVSAQAVHISQVEGIGVRLPQGSEAARRWGGGGERLTLISPETFNRVVTFARDHNLPIGLEPDYSFDPLTFKEADRLLEPILKNITQ